MAADHPMARKLVTSDEACVARGQHRKPCADCPWTRTALSGWLGAQSATQWLAVAHGEAQVECHTALGAQCAGLAIYRANTGKRPRDPDVLQLPKDTRRVFATAQEFRAHHETEPATGMTMPTVSKTRHAKRAVPAKPVRPTATAIRAEIDRLEAMKPTVHRRSMFGDDHHAAINVQLEVLRDDLDMDEIVDRWGNLDGEDHLANLYDAAREARDWMTGDRPEGPSQEWQELVVKR